MKEIKNVYNGESAFIVGELIACGCRLLRADELDNAAKTYNIDNSKLKEIKDALGSETNWDEVVTHESICVRAACVRQRVGLDILVKDKDWGIRIEVARQGYSLDVLVNDPNVYVRGAAKKQLEMLTNV